MIGIARQSRASLLAGAAVMSIAILPPAQAEDVPSVQELYLLFKDQQRVMGEQQKLILEQQKRIQELERRAAKSETDIVRTRQSVKANTDAVKTTQREVEATRKDVLDTKTVVATKEDLDRTKAELGTQPSQSVFRTEDSPSRFFAFGEFLYLRPTTDLVAFTARNFANPQTITTTGLDHSYEPGFRIGLGYRFAGPMDVALSYTYLRADSTTNASRGSADGFMFAPAFGNGPFFCCGATDTADGTFTYKLKYDVVDAELGLNFMIGSSMRMRGIAGLRYVRLDQFGRADIVSQRGADTGVTTGEGKANYWGIGPRLAIKGMWELGGGFAIDGGFGGSVTVGSSRVRGSNASILNGTTVFQGTSDGPSSARMVPGVEAAIGIAYTHNFGSMALKAAVGYQFNHWFNLPNFAGGSEGSSFQQKSMGLGLDGFFVKAAITW